MWRKLLLMFFTLIMVGGSVLAWKTTRDLLPPPETLSLANTNVYKAQIVDRHNTPLTITYQNDWNLHDIVALHEIPEILQQLFVLSEDKRFFEHQGPDWYARWHAVWQDIKSLRAVRGASTITEQVVRMIHPRPRNMWSRWVEGFEAARFEKQFSKTDILEFYLNQVPYARQRRGVVQAARYYFNRDVDTLNLKEMLALVILVRSPSRLDLRRDIRAIERPIARFAQRLAELGVITHSDYQMVLTAPLNLQPSDLPIQATHFANYVYAKYPDLPEHSSGRLHTTLDATIQHFSQQILDSRLKDLHNKNVNNGAVLVVDHQRHETLAWVNGNTIRDNQIDAVTTPRQPGSTLKPLLYAVALEKGWTAATLINDAPLAEAVGMGMHSYRNYSHSYYGLLRLRDALGNSLNIPAVQAIQFVGADTFLQRLRQLGISSLTAEADFYGDGLALGNGGLTLFELVQAYAALANQGQFHPLKILKNTTNYEQEPVFSPEISSLIADILSDPDARRLEFGRGTLLRFPVQTAVKTGTSNDYRDAWAIGFNHRYTVGVWLGNLDQQPMSHVSGSTGPALVLRGIFAELNRYQNTQPLYLSPHLVKVEICRENGLPATTDCASRPEWFIPGTEPSGETTPPIDDNQPLRLRQPSDGLQLALDPRIPDEAEAFALILSNTHLQPGSIDWLIDGQVIGTTSTTTRQFLWPVQLGAHIAQARIHLADNQTELTTPQVAFHVK